MTHAARGEEADRIPVHSWCGQSSVLSFQRVLKRRKPENTIYMHTLIKKKHYNIIQLNWHWSVAEERNSVEGTESLLWLQHMNLIQIRQHRCASTGKRSNWDIQTAQSRKERLMCITLVIIIQCCFSSREQQSALRSHELHTAPVPKEAGPNSEFLKLSYSEIKFQHIALFYQPVSCICADSHSFYLLLHHLILNLAGKPQSFLVYYKISYFTHLTYHWAQLLLCECPAQTGYQSWFKGIRSPILRLWLIILTAKRWYLPSTHLLNFRMLGFICQILKTLKLSPLHQKHFSIKYFLPVTSMLWLCPLQCPLCGGELLCPSQVKLTMFKAVQYSYFLPVYQGTRQRIQLRRLLSSCATPQRDKNAPTIQQLPWELLNTDSLHP